jgi:hypothetical protein
VRSRLTFLVPLALIFSACSGSGTAGDAGDGGPIPDICNSLPDGGLDRLPDGGLHPECQLALGQQSQCTDPTQGCYYINKAGKQLWLSVDIPASTSSKSLFHLRASYSAPSTPVQLAVNILAADGTTSLATGFDDHQSGKPQPIDIVLPYSVFGSAGTPLLIQCTDSTLRHFDDQSPFQIFVEVLPDPDPNTPGTATPVSFSAPDSSGVSSGTCGGAACTGVISVTGRVDEFALNLPTSSAAHQIFYLNITAPSTSLTPPVAYDLAYQLLDSTGTVVVTDYALSPYQDVDLATARLVDNPPYTLKVFAFMPPNATAPSPGDLRQTYTVVVKVMPDVNPQEQGPTLPNSFQTAAPVNFAAGDLDGAPKTVTGRISYVADNDWYAVSLPASASSTRLHYLITPLTTGGRFASIPPNQPGDRIVEVSSPVIAATSMIAQEICLANPPTTQCPVDLNAPQSALNLQASLCDQGDAGALCLFSERLETPGWDKLSNFEGIVPIPPHPGAAAIYYVDYQSQEGTYADDLDYTVTLWWQSEGPENATGYHWDFSTAIPFSMPVDTGAANFPDPSGVPGASRSGAITLGHLYGKDTSPTDTPVDSIYGPSDYDAIPSTIDTYELDFPAGAAATFPFGATWELQWKLAFDGGTAPMALGLQVAFCDGTIAGDAGCNIVSGSGPTNPNGNGPGLGTIGYDTTPADSWYNYAATYTGDLEPLWDLQSGPGGLTITARPYGCFCMQENFLQSGKFYIQVVGLDRKVYQDVSYTLSTALAPYPQSFGADGGTFSCPINIPMADAGCDFTYMHP